MYKSWREGTKERDPPAGCKMRPRIDHSITLLDVSLISAKTVLKGGGQKKRKTIGVHLRPLEENANHSNRFHIRGHGHRVVGLERNEGSRRIARRLEEGSKPQERTAGKTSRTPVPVTKDGTRDPTNLGPYAERAETQFSGRGRGISSSRRSGQGPGRPAA